MVVKKLPPGAVIYQNERFKIPPGWRKADPRKTNRDYIKESAGYTLKAICLGQHDDWVFQVWTDGKILRDGIASSRLAAMRKAELVVYARTVGFRHG